ncbi:MAG: LPS export ABC transporter periplasmic protein LptC [Candidatus Dadabacteria bacterium]|nr:MAG: LPS export ABC transporter periplasmic protein LptC [Candidatus Dadabacteria bacterium]
MALSKTYSRYLALLIFVIFVIIAWYYSAKNSQVDSASGLSNVAAQPTPELVQGAFKLGKFKRSKLKDGRTVWEITAESGEYMPAKNLTRVYNARMVFYDKKNVPVLLESKRADLNIKADELSSAELFGDVKLVYNNDLTLTTRHALYNRELNVIKAPGTATVQNQRMKISGKKMTINVITKELLFERAVSSVIYPASLESSNEVL